MRDFIKKRLMKKYAYYNLCNDVESFFMCGVRMVLYVKLMIREVLCLIYECKKVFLVLFLIIYLCISYMKKIKNLYVWMFFFILKCTLGISFKLIIKEVKSLSLSHTHMSG